MYEWENPVMIGFAIALPTINTRSPTGFQPVTTTLKSKVPIFLFLKEPQKNLDKPGPLYV